MRKMRDENEKAKRPISMNVKQTGTPSTESMKVASPTSSSNSDGELPGMTLTSGISCMSVFVDEKFDDNERKEGGR